VPKLNFARQHQESLENVLWDDGLMYADQRPFLSLGDFFRIGGVDKEVATRRFGGYWLAFDVADKLQSHLIIRLDFIEK